jgi:very-short-patch-repair endonuclease
MPVHDADGAVAELAASQHGALTRSQAAECGLPPRMIRSRLAAGVFDAPHPGVLTVASTPPTWRRQLKAATLARPGRLLVSVRAAGALHALDGLDPTMVEIHSPAEMRVRLEGVIVHRVADLATGDRHVIDGIPVTSLARTLADLGSVLPLDAVERALDDARRRGVSVRWLRETATRLHRPGQSGTSTLLRLLDAAEKGGRVRDSWFEALVERCLRSPQLPPLVRQYEVRDVEGQLAGRVDVAFPSVKLAVEAHSRQHHFGRAAEPLDERRDLRLAALGWEVLYVGWQDTRSPAELLAVVESVARTRKLGRC